MAREYLSIEQLMAAPTVPDSDPYRISEARRIYQRTEKGWRDIWFKLLDDVPSGFQSPSEEHRDFLDYLDLFGGVLTGLEKQFGKSVGLLRSSNGQDKVVNLEAMRIDVSALNYARRYLGIKDCA